MKPIANLNSVIAGFCDGGDCNRRAVSLAYDEKLNALIPVCRRHILVYRVGKLWQAEDEAFELQFARRSRFRWLAQRRILRDQRRAARATISAPDLTHAERAEVDRFGIHDEDAAASEWVVRVIGPDVVLPARDMGDAMRQAHMINGDLFESGAYSAGTLAWAVPALREWQGV